MGQVCANCGIEIHWQPTHRAGKVYCCAGCGLGGPCTCDYEHLPQPDAAERAPLDGAEQAVGYAQPGAPAGEMLHSLGKAKQV